MAEILVRRAHNSTDEVAVRMARPVRATVNFDDEPSDGLVLCHDDQYGRNHFLCTTEEDLQMQMQGDGLEPTAYWVPAADITFVDDSVYPTNDARIRFSFYGIEYDGIPVLYKRRGDAMELFIYCATRSIDDEAAYWYTPTQKDRNVFPFEILPQ